MKSIDLVLDQEALLKYILPDEHPANSPEHKDIEAFKAIVAHHRFVWAEALVDIFEQMGETEAALIQGIIRDENGTGTEKIEDINITSLDEWIPSIPFDDLLEDWYVICDTQKSASKINEFVPTNKVYTIKKLPEQTIDNRIKRITPDCHIRAQNGADCDAYVEWFGELFEGEKTISLFDPYLAKEEGFNCMATYLAPQMKGATVYIFTGLKEWEKSEDNLRKEWDKLAIDNQLTLQIFTSEGNNKEHDRHIFLSANTHITIGRSFDFLDVSTGKIRGTEISVLHDETNTYRTIQAENQRYIKKANFPEKQKRKIK